MSAVFLSIGSNIHPETHIPKCIQYLKKEFAVKKISSVYETEPVGPAGSENFWNMAVEIETALSHDTLTGIIRKIEMSLERRRSPKNKFEPRTIDIDILPQKGFQNLAFIVVPLAEIAPQTRDPETQKTFAELAQAIGKDAPKLYGIKKIEVCL